MTEANYGKPYIPLRDYNASAFKPIGQSPNHFCVDCKSYYKKLYEAGISKNPFPPNCTLDLSLNKQDVPGISDEDRALLDLYRTPVTFAAAEFNWKPRWYQIQMLHCTSQYVVVRGGRRLGKSQVIAVLILWYLYTNKDHTILVVCPYQSQVKSIFNQMRKFINNSISYKNSVSRDVQSAPEHIELLNGSKVIGFSSGANSGGKSSQVRGQDANFMILDEMDMLSDADLESIMAILASHPDCRLWCSSTPTGARRQFFNFCVNKDMGYKEWHLISSESPSWTPQVESQLKMMYTDASYAREFYAEFGEETLGVFKNKDINSSIRNYKYEECFRQPLARYAMGVDWNDNAGTHIVITECFLNTSGDIKYKVVEKVIVEKQEFTQNKAVEEIIRLNSKWDTEYIYVDAGYGAVQIEMLHKYGKENPSTGLDKKVIGLQMGSNIEIKDPLSGAMVKKPVKPFIVNIAARQVESGRCLFPELEDTSAMGDEDEIASSTKVGLIQQLRMFKVEKESRNGQPIYSQGADHTLTAWMLTLTAFFIHLSDVNKSNHSTSIGFTGKLGEKMSEEEKMKSVKEKNKELKKKLMPTKRTISEPSKYSRFNAARAMHNEKMIKRADNRRRIDSLRINYPKPSKRTNF